MNDFEAVFYELFYGAGIWLGLLLILVIITGLTLKSKNFSILCLPVTFFLAISYITEGTENCLWGGLIMIFTSIFIIVNLVRDR